MAASLLSRGVLPRPLRTAYQSFMCISSRWLSYGERGSDIPPSSEIPSSSDTGVQSPNKADLSSEDQVIDNLRTSSSLQGKDNTVMKTKLSPTEGAIDKFGKVIEKVKKLQEETEVETVPSEDRNESFASMFRKSKFVSLGEPIGRLVKGEIIEIMENDLYIDFGGKFHCVCPRPFANPDRYQRGTKVIVNLQAPEMSSAFLGSDIHVTLLEADGVLLGLASSASKFKSSASRSSTDKTTAKS